ncbi:protein HIRA-like [Dendronephthya gigantea]|uniref:protein HIRA-like n=1 Tax=Dendronephthya gigantea TaxID=151771 RepID=UPI00106CA010|nr:protein HIRA-like [Dendronephthya gigantea]
MRLLKPAWVSQEGKPIYSVDIHPDGSRFVTGGQGDDAGKVVIWNMAPVRSEAQENNKEIPKLLCQMDNHLACVNSVRWSCSGTYLASGGDDKLIMIWQTGRYLGITSSFGSKAMNVEQWRCVHILRGHTGDVLDLCWSPDDSMLASSSVDNTVYIWNAQKFPEVTSVLKQHSGMVKGVTWDPIGKYMASQSDDKYLNVWRTSDWQLETQISEPFEECSGTTHVLRLGWSPDGHYVVSAHAMNNRGPVAKIVERDGWKCRMDFAGHRKAITVVRWNPRLFTRASSNDSTKLKQFCCCAIGSRDRSVSIWMTTLKRPMVVMHDLFDQSVMDISWSSCGYEMIVCSSDGTVAFFQFEKKEMGDPMSVEDKEQLHKKIYGTSIATVNRNVATSIIENPEMLKIQQQHKMKKALEKKSNAGEKPPPPPLIRKDDTSAIDSPGTSLLTPSSMTSPVRSEPTRIDVLKQQIETRTKDGRRRITPLFVAAQVDIGGPPVPFGSSPLKSSSVTSNMPTSSLESRISEKTPVLSAIVSPAKKTNNNTATLSKVTSLSSPTPPAHSSQKSNSSTSSPATISVKRKVESSSSQSKRSKKDKETAPKTVSASSSASKQKSSDDKIERDEVDTSFNNSQSIALPYPSPQKTLSLKITGVMPDSPVTLQLENNLSHSASNLNVLKCTQPAKLIWETCIKSPGIALAGNRNIACVACQDRSLCIFSSSGRRILPNLVLDSSVSILQCNVFYVMVVTSRGGVYVWDAQKRTAIVKNESVQPILRDSEVTISRAAISEKGYPIISLSTEASYTFNADLGVWVQLSSPEDPLQLNSDFKSCYNTHEVSKSHGILATLQGQTSRFSRPVGRLFRSSSARPQTATISHLENQISSTLMLGSEKEYHFWFMTYVRYLVQEGIDTRLRDVCSELLGPSFRSTTWEPYILGFQKRELLREILPIIGTNMRLQRMFTEYKEQLSIL